MAGPELCRTVRAGYGADCYVIMLTALNGEVRCAPRWKPARTTSSTSRWIATSCRCGWPSPSACSTLRAQGRPSSSAKGVAFRCMSTVRRTSSRRSSNRCANGCASGWRRRRSPRPRRSSAQYYRRAPAADLRGREPVDLYGAALAHWTFGARPRRPARRACASTTRRSSSTAGSRRTRRSTIVSDDMPFLVDSVSMELSRREAGIHVLVHPVVGDESYMHIEIDRQADGLRGARGRRCASVLAQVRAAVEDWQPMRERMQALIDEPTPAGMDADEFEEARALLAWVGRPPLHLPRLPRVRAHRGRADAVEGSGLGPAARRRRPVSTAFAKLPLARARARPRARTRWCSPRPPPARRSTAPRTWTTSASRSSTTSGNVVGERRFLGLYTTAAYREVPAQHPGAAAQGRRPCASAPGSRPAATTTRRWSRSSTPSRATSCSRSASTTSTRSRRGILELGERQRVRLFMRTDRYERFVSCLVFIPRDRFNTANRRQDRRDPAGGARRRVRRLGAAADRVGARAHPLHAAPAAPGARPTYDAERARGADRRGDPLVGRRPARGAAVEELGEEPGWRSSARYGAAFPAAYRDDLLARSAVADVQRIEGLDGDDALDLSLYRPLEARAGRAALQALPARRAGVAVRRAADVRVARADGDRRAALPRDAARRPAGVDLRLRPAGARRRSTPTRSASASTRASCACGTARPSRTASTG